MTRTHLSHLGLTEIAQNAEAILIEGTLGNCRRMLAAHGCEMIERNETAERWDSQSGMVSTLTKVSPTMWWLELSRDTWQED